MSAKIPLPNNLPCPPLEFDILDLFCGGSFPINDKLVIRQPTIGEIRAFGERKYFHAVQTLCRIPSDIKYELDQIGKNYMEIPDFELFFLLTRDMTPDDTRLFLGDIDLSRLEPGIRESNQDLVLVDPEHGLVIDRMLYTKLATTLRRMHGFEYKPEYATNKYTLRALIEDAKFKHERDMRERKPYQSYLGQMVISLVCTEEFKYSSKTVQDIGICELVISYQQICKKKNALALLQGSYSGMIDVSKIDKSRFSWIFESSYLDSPPSPPEQPSSTS